MKQKFQIKEELYKICEEDTERRINTLEEILKSIKESRNNETKSSVGDKYETGRSMMQMEEEKNKRQLLQVNQVKNELRKIDLRKRPEKVETGSLVTTNKGVYFISIGIGKAILGDQLYYCK